LSNILDKYWTLSRLANRFRVAKTVADCFKHRNKIGMDVALEALKDARTQGR
jgi:hypothetical protein